MSQVEEQPLKRFVRDIPREGANGFSESWYPICASTDILPGAIRPVDFIDGQVVVWREEGGTAHVQSAFCVHFGAHLETGRINGDRIVCPFHFWEYDGTGQCRKTGIGDAPPKRARLFKFPTVERYGLIWAFNGLTPTWSLPDFAFPDAALNQIVVGGDDSWPVDPWMVCCNTLDLQHFQLLHGIEYPNGWPADEEIDWGEHHVAYSFEGLHWNKEPFNFRWGIWGTTIFFQEGYFDGKWFGLLAPMTIRKSGSCSAWFVCVTHIGDGSPAARREAESWGRWALDMETRFAMQDVPIFTRSNFRPGIFTQADKPLIKFTEYLRRFPRNDTAREFLR